MPNGTVTSLPPTSRVAPLSAPQQEAVQQQVGALAGRRVTVGAGAGQRALSMQASQHAQQAERPSLFTRAATKLRSALKLARPIHPSRSRALSAPAQLTPKNAARGIGAGVRRQSLAQIATKDILAAGHISKLSNYLANGAESGKISTSQRKEMESLIMTAAQVDNDMLRSVELLEKSETTPLNDAERQELQSLVGANKHNLALLQTWLGNRVADLASQGALTPEAKTLYQALESRLADRHMDLADLVSLHDLDTDLEEPVSRADRASGRLLHAEAAVRFAEGLSVEGLSAGDKEKLVDELKAHRDQLANIRDAASGRIKTPGPGETLELASKALWEEPLPLVKPKKGAPDEIKGLQARWASDSKEPPLPIGHGKVSEPRMLQEFVNFRLKQAGVAKQNMPSTKADFQHAYEKVLNDQPWDAIERNVYTTLPNSGGKAVHVRSNIVPGKALAKNFAEDYESNGINCADRSQYKHIPNLARTTLTNASGETLFDGLRHGILDAYDISGKTLARMPEDQLRTMVGDLLVGDGPNAGTDALGVQAGSEADIFMSPADELWSSPREERIDGLVNRIRSDPAEASKAAGAMRNQASRNMAHEMAAAALIKDPAKFQKALDGETVNVDLSSISLVTPDYLRHAIKKGGHSDEQVMLKNQMAGFDALGAAGGPVELQVRDANGEPRTVKANVNVRQFNFGVNAGGVGTFKAGPIALQAKTPGWRNLMGWGFAMERNNPALDKLVGAADDTAVGGDVKAKVDSMRDSARDLRAERSDLLQQIGVDGPNHPDAATRRARLETLSKDIAGLEKNARTLSQASEQVKTIWGNREYWSGGGDPYKMVSRLALVGQLMGETPLFNCKSGKDRTGQLDAEVKFLATVADEQNGRLPAVDQDMQLWRSARSDFTLNTGNLEMQKVNTGLPGYKLEGVAGLDNLMAEGMRPVYRGGSNYVAS